MLQTHFLKIDLTRLSLTRHAGMDGRHPGAQDASGDIRVGLDSSTPCWNDAIE
jgi:hypothetical protein